MQTKIKLQNRNEKWLTLFFNHPRYDFFVLLSGLLCYH